MKHSFLNGHNLRKLNKKYNEFLSYDEYKKPHNCFVKVNSFQQLDILSGARNGVSSVVQPIETLIGVSALKWTTGEKYTPNLYIKADAKTSHDFGSKVKVLFVYIDKKGRKNSRELYKTWDKKDFECPKYILNYSSDNYKSKSYQIKWRYERYIESKFKDLMYDEMYNMEYDRELSQEFIDFCSKFGLKIVETFAYTHKFEMFGLQGVKQKGLNLQLAIKDTSTYCSLPKTIDITFKKSNLNLIRLADLKIETSGYYSHSENLKIKPNDLKKSKVLFNKFKSISKVG